MVIDTDCTTCGGLGTLGCDPETHERIYCDACAYGVEMHLDDVIRKGEACGAWLRERCQEGGERWLEEDVDVAQEHLWSLLEEHGGLCALLDTLKQDETNRPRAHLFEDA